MHQTALEEARVPEQTRNCLQISDRQRTFDRLSIRERKVLNTH